MGEGNQRESDCLTVHAADLLPVETSWRGMPHSPLILLETPHRQLVPFSPWDASLSDANLLIMAASGGGKTFMAMLFLLMMSRIKPMISILERGDSYRPLVELMGGRCIDVDLEGRVALNPWDLPPGTTAPGKDKIAFLKNLTRHMIGESTNSDTALLRLVSSEWDRELSFDVVQLLLPLYGGESADGVAERLRNRCITDSADIQEALRREQISAHDRSVVMLQPEVLMIYDGLRTDRCSLRDRWSERYPEEELERVTNAFGYTL
jgi:hypothetical protein